MPLSFLRRDIHTVNLTTRAVPRKGLIHEDLVRIFDYVLRLYLVTHFFSCYHGNIRRAVVNARRCCRIQREIWSTRRMNHHEFWCGRLFMVESGVVAPRSGNIWSFVDPAAKCTRVLAFESTNARFYLALSSSKQICFLISARLYLKEMEGRTLVRRIFISSIYASYLCSMLLVLIACSNQTYFNCNY